MGTGYTADGSVRVIDFPVTLAFGLVDSLELSVGTGGQVQVDSTGSDTDTTGDWLNAGVGFKWKFIGDDSGLLGLRKFQDLGDHAISISVFLPASSTSRLGTGEVDLDVVYIISKSLTDKLNGHVNLAYTYLGDSSTAENDDLFRAGIAIDYQWTEDLQPVLEVVSQTPLSSGDPTDVGINTGLRWAVAEGLVLDAAVGTRLAGNWPDLTATIGFTWSFP